MKKWDIPRIISMDVSMTAYDVLEGEVVDGTWLDYEECEWKDAYYS